MDGSVLDIPDPKPSNQSQNKLLNNKKAFFINMYCTWCSGKYVFFSLKNHYFETSPSSALYVGEGWVTVDWKKIQYFLYYNIYEHASVGKLQGVPLFLPY